MSQRSFKEKSALNEEDLSIHERMVEAAMRSEPPKTPTEDSNDILQFLRSSNGETFRNSLLRLVAAFRARTEKSKVLALRPLTPEPQPNEPSSTEDDHTVPDSSKLDTASTEGSPENKKPAPNSKTAKTVQGSTPPVSIKVGRISITIPELFHKIPRPKTFDPLQRLYLGWLAVLSTFFIYNSVVIPYRSAFVDYEAQSWFYWLFVDYAGDLVYLADVVIWKPCVRVYHNGIEVAAHKEIVRQYVQTNTFLLDILSVLPLDLFYLISSIGINPLFRVFKVLKILSYWELMDRIDQLLTSPYYFRVLRSVAYMMYLIHVNACIFYYFSYLHDFDPEDGFVYNNMHPRCLNISMSTAQPVNETDTKTKCNFPGTYSAYMFCFFFSVSMVTIIGNLNFPGTIASIVYSAILWFLGVFVFATLVGQIRDVLKAMTRQEDEFYEVMDAIVDHMHHLKIPRDLQDRVRTWLLYNWEQQKTTDEGKLLEGLPVRLRSAMAMEVHLGVISKVQLFKDVDKSVLEELLLRLKPNVFLPNDYICKRGEIGKEMYIIKSGILEVLMSDGRVAVTLSPGSVFGEISLLALAGGNRRTADVRSKGFSNLYVLSKSDLTDVMKDYPETFEELKTKAQELLKKGKPSERPPSPPVEIIRDRAPTPEMVHLVYQLLQTRSREQLHSRKRAMVHRTSIDSTEIELTDLPNAANHQTAGDNLRTATPDPVFDVTAEIAINKPSSSAAEFPPSTHNAESTLNKTRTTSSKPDESSSEVDQRSSSDSRPERQVPVPLHTHTTSEPARNNDNKNAMEDTSSKMMILRRRLFNSPKITPISTSTPSLRRTMATTPPTDSVGSTTPEHSSASGSEMLRH